MTETQKQAPASLISKLTAIRRLMADPGATAGEKAAATQMYEKLKREYGLTDQLIESDSYQIYKFAFKDQYEKKLLMQILYKVLGKEGSKKRGYWDRNPWTGKGSKVAIWVELTTLESKDVAALYAHYRRELAKWTRNFYSAFIAANDIYPDDAPTDQGECERTVEEIKELQEILDLAQSIHPSPIPVEHPLLEGNN